MNKEQQKDIEWVQHYLGPNYFIEWDHEYSKTTVKENTPSGIRELRVLKDPDGNRIKYLDEKNKRELYLEVLKFRNSKYGKQSYNDYEMREKWHKDIKSRVSKYTKKLNDGSGDVGVYRSDTHERVG